MLIKANEATAGRRVMTFPLVVDVTDFGTPETGEAAGQPQYSVDGGANWTNTSGTLTGGTNGAYQVQLTQAEVNQAVGTTIIGRYKSANTAEARASIIQIVAFDPNSASDLGLTNLDAAISTRGTADTGDAMTLTEAYDAAKTAAQAGAKMDIVDVPNATAVTAIQNGLAATGEAATAVATLNDFDPATDVVAHVTLVDTTTTNTDMRGTNGAELSGAAAAAVATLNDFDPATDEVDIGAVKGVAVVSIDDFKANVSGLALAGEAATAVGTLTIPSANDVADQVWNEATADHSVAGSAGKALADAGSAGDPWSTTLPGAYGDNTAGNILGANLDAKVSTRSTLTAAQVWAAATRTITGGAYNGTPPSAADIATAVWGSTTRSLTTFGSLVVDVVSGVWGAVARTITGGTVTTNSDKSGYSLAADQAVNVTKVGGTVVAGPDDLKANVSGLATSSDITALNDLSAAQVQTAVGTALGTYDGPTKAELDSAVSPLATATALTTVSGKVDTIDGIVDAIKLQTDNLPAAPAAVGSAMTLSVAERAAVAAALLATNITYPDGSTKTVESVLEEVWATTAGDTNIVNLVQQFLWPDNQTVAVTYDIDDADAPTSRTRQ